jgi:hypothetical protein
MERRDLLRAAAAAAALAFVPRNAEALWTRVAAGVRPENGLTDAQLKLIGGIADTILPRTDIPSATDVGVPAFVDVIFSENLEDAERAAAVAGLDAIDAKARADSGAAFVDLSEEARHAVLDKIEDMARDVEPAKTYWQLKGLVVHGYFTSEPIMKEVLKVPVMPGRFDGAVPVKIKRALPNATTGGHAHG